MMTPERFIVWTTALTAGGTIWHQVLWKRVIMPIRKYFTGEAETRARIEKELLRQGEVQTDQGEILQVLQREARYNGGGSMKDQMLQHARDLRVLKHLFWMSDRRARAEWRPAISLNSAGAQEIRWFCSRVTQQFTEITGLHAHQCNYDGWADAVHITQRDEVLAAWRRSRTDGAIFTKQYTLTHAQDGGEFPSKHREEPIIDPDGTVLAWIVEITVISADAEERRQRSIAKP